MQDFNMAAAAAIAAAHKLQHMTYVTLTEICLQASMSWLSEFSYCC